MNTTILSYPGFQSLPKGIRRMLVASEAHFFDQPAPHHKGQEESAHGRCPAWEPFKRGAYDQGVGSPVCFITNTPVHFGGI